MNPRATIVEWEAAVAAASGANPFASLLAETSRALQTLQHAALPGLVLAHARLVLVEPAHSRSRLAPLVGSVQDAVHALASPAARTAVPPSSRLAILDLVNIVACTGTSDVTVADAIIHPWLAELSGTDLPTVAQLRVGFAALALKAPDVAAQVADHLGRPVTPFDPSNRCRGDAPGLLGHLVGAQRHNADRFAVFPAWRAAVENITELRADGQVDEATVLWMARLMYHDYRRQPLNTVAEAAHEILWRVPVELEREAADRFAALAPPPVEPEFPLGYTLGGGSYRVEERLIGDGTQQLFAGRHVATGDPILLAYDIRGSRRSVDELRTAISYRIPGVFDLGFVGGFDPHGGEQDHMCETTWATVELVPQGTWLPRILPAAHDPQVAPLMAIELGLTAGRILARAAAEGVLLVRVRPQYMWAQHTEGKWQVTGLSARGDELFMRKSTEMVTVPLFDRYYYAPEWYRAPDERSLVFSLAVMIAEWAMGQYPFEHLFPGKGLEQADYIAIAAPAPLTALLEEALQYDRDQRPYLRQFLRALEMLVAPTATSAHGALLDE